MKLKQIHRTSTFAWSPTPSLPLLATGTVAGALDESFSNNGQLEIWAPDFLDKHEYDIGGEGQPSAKGSVTTSSRFNRLAWGYADGGRPRGVVVAGMENGELDIWDPEKIVANAAPSESLILRNKTHTGPVRGLDFNPIQKNLFSSGAVNGEIYIWDLNDPSKPYSPGTRSTKLDEITAVAWNHHVQYALAVSSSTGYTVVWDLKGKREVAALAYGGGAGTLAGQAFGGAGMNVGGRRGMSDVAWHPDNPTRLVTSSEDDTSPVIMVWDLRNARAPEKILTGHEKGVLSLSWCKQDSDLLLSCGKDNRALCWNPQTSEIIGELPSADNWAFQVQWCPRNPDMFATACFDGTVGIHSIQSTNETESVPSSAPRNETSDIFDSAAFSRAAQPTLSLKQPPKWLRRPTSNSFGYGGKLVTVSNLPSAQGKTQSSVVHIRNVVTETDIVDRAKRLQTAIEGETLHTLAEEKSTETDKHHGKGSESWKALLSLFKANSRDELITLLGFSKSEIAARVEEAVASLTAASEQSGSVTEQEQDVTETDIKLHEPVVSFAEPEHDAYSEVGDDDGANAIDATPSEISVSGTSDDTASTTRLGDGDSTTTAPSLFGDDNVGTPQTDAAADFFGSIGISRSSDAQMRVPHQNYAPDSSVAATVGSRPSSAASEVLKANTFRIYPNDESDTDRLVTKALVLGDFESAVSLCLSSDRFADAILLAVRGGPELLQQTQKAYFERRTTALPYLRLFQSIVTNDLADVVQNADLQEWQEIFVVLCTFASQEEFSSLAEQLGQRLEFQSSLAKADANTSTASEYRKNATLTYLAAGRLERLVNIWVEELAEEEKAAILDEANSHASRYAAHAQALQTFMEKVSVFRSAIKYADADLVQSTSTAESDARTYKLSGLYDRYFEYADLLAAQGLVKEAVAFLNLTPPGYHGSPGSPFDFKAGREQLLSAAGVNTVPVRSSSLSTPAPAVPSKIAPVASTSSIPTHSQYTVPTHQHQTSVPYVPAVPAMYDSYNTAPSVPNTYTPAGVTQSKDPYQSTAPMTYNNPYSQPSSQSQPPAFPNQQGYPNQQQQGFPNQQQQGFLHQQQQGGVLRPPPQGPPIKRDNSGWNDAPAVAQKRGPGALNLGKPAAITSPFPNAPASSTPVSPFASHGQAPSALPPPPRPGSVQQRPPPPPQGHRMPGRPPSGPPGSQHMASPPSRMMSPPQGPGISTPPPGQYATPPLQRGPSVPGQNPPPGPYGRATPPLGAGASSLPPGVAGSYSRATPSPSYIRAGSPPQAHAGMYATPPQGSFAPPPPQQGSFAPPPQSSFAQPPQQNSFMPSQQQGSYGHSSQSGHTQGPPPSNGSAAPPQGPPRGQAAAPSRAKAGPAPPKYPPGDRSHIPDKMRPACDVISEQLNHLKQTTPPQQKRLVDDLERRINPLFDALNCETLSPAVCDQLLVLTRAMEAHDRDAAMGIHMDLLTRGSLTDDIGLWMSGVKQLIVRL